MSVACRLLVLVILLAVPAVAQTLRFEPEGPLRFAYGERATIDLVATEVPEESILGTLPVFEGIEFSADAPRLMEDGSIAWRLRIEALRPGPQLLAGLTIDTGEAVYVVPTLEIFAAKEAVGAERIALRIEPRGEDALAILVEVDAGFLDVNMLQEFKRPLDVPLRLVVPWADEVELLDSTEGFPRRSLVLNGKLVEALLVEDEPGRPVFEIRFLVPSGRRSAAFAEVAGVFSFATRFEEDFFSERRPVDRRGGRVYSNALDPGPGEGVPADAESPPTTAAGLPPGDAAALRDDRISSTALFGFLLVPFVLGLLHELQLRRRDRDRADPLGARARRALASFRRDLRGGSRPADEILGSYLAARLRLSEPSMHDPRLAEVLGAAGLGENLVDETLSTMSALVARRYGEQSGTHPHANGLESLVNRLEAHFRNREGAR